MKGEKWKDVIFFVNSNNMWHEAKVMRDQHADVLAAWMTARNIESDFRASCEFLSVHGKNWQRAVNEIREMHEPKQLKLY